MLQVPCSLHTHTHKVESISHVKTQGENACTTCKFTELPDIQVHTTARHSTAYNSQKCRFSHLSDMQVLTTWWHSEEDHLSVEWGCWTSCLQVMEACCPCPSSHIESHLEPADPLASHLYRLLPCLGHDLQHGQTRNVVAVSLLV